MDTRYDRPGWLRCEQFGAGMITGWGAHHIDIAHWAMDLSTCGPVEIGGHGGISQEGPVGRARAVSRPGALCRTAPMMYISEKYPNGLRFIGEDGWIWVTRGRYKPEAGSNGLAEPDVWTQAIRGC